MAEKAAPRDNGALHEDISALREDLERLTCPIGVAGISGKKPAEIAVAAAAEVLQAYESAARWQSEYPANVRPFRRSR